MSAAKLQSLSPKAQVESDLRDANERLAIATNALSFLIKLDLGCTDGPAMFGLRLSGKVANDAMNSIDGMLKGQIRRQR